MKYYIMIVCFVFSFLAVGCQEAVNSDNLETKELYLIIVSDDYTGSNYLTEFKNFREKDFNVKVVSPNDIGEDKDSYRNYIREIMPQYVLLIGKYGDFPTLKVPHNN
ncbi:MAG: hypothetical protein CSB55_04315 [Candidatus Cloacimonadota bacterium]|nr:MAG: hypothetical protein CSB55_04315 [Candidatus Cloacimonadota bacterium]